MAVFVLDKRKQPLIPCSEKGARLLLTRARVRRYPFTIRLKDRVGGEVQPVRVKIDPGSKPTGSVVVTEERGNKPAKVLCLFEIAEVPNGKKAGVYVGRVAVRASGSFTVGNADGINATYCKILHRADGSGWRRALPPRRERRCLQRGEL